MSNQDRLLSDEELRGNLNSIFSDAVVSGHYSCEEMDCHSKGSPINRMEDLINTQKRLYAESEQAEQKAVISALAERLNDAIKKGRKYIKISEVEYSIGKNLAEQRARIK